MRRTRPLSLEDAETPGDLRRCQQCLSHRDCFDVGVVVTAAGPASEDACAAATAASEAPLLPVDLDAAMKSAGAKKPEHRVQDLSLAGCPQAVDVQENLRVFVGQGCPAEE